MPDAAGKRPWTRRHSCLAGGVGCLTIAGLALLLLMFTHVWEWAYIRNWGDLPFDAQRWKTADTRAIECVRGQMVKSLLRTHRLTGMSREQVVELLGPPDNAEAPSMGREPEIGYYLGMRGGFGVDPDMLWLWLDRGGKVKGWSIDTS